MTSAAMLSGNHGCLVGISKPTVFTGASAMFLLVYLALWKYHDINNPLMASASSLTGDETRAAISLQDNIIEQPEQVTSCDPHVNVTTFKNESVPVIYFVTPTYARSVQMAELTRLGQTLSSVPALHWILVEDAPNCNPAVGKLLRRLGIPFTHLASAMPSAYKKLKNPPRGVSNRRAALQWIRSNVKQGVLYFGDDDNSYDLRLFDEIRDTRNISMFPVGLVGDYAVSAPVVYDGKVVGFYDSWPAGRRFAVDMAGFAVNIKLLHQFPNATFVYKVGFEEDSFLQEIVTDVGFIEAKAANCTQILVWHTRTVQVPMAMLQPPTLIIDDTSISGLLHALDENKLASFSTSRGKPSSVHYLTDV
ncbi:galactosylgalactosylxylosylprotein 3-beta-glucuronosyltransferase S-like [Daphnia pulex]|uniref:galactosylgalactosylxylosylprotein 3-beta-glucuronosyltransferase S-like n=1 Tax=Daphnia pulex TaxID=6669 RepID=UPI001EDFFB96|nr:galactosylgalactosylxylosylprotein 3-beta-glucuronosyltransferase S-like [Daphnia pulex]